MLRGAYAELLLPALAASDDSAATWTVCTLWKLDSPSCARLQYEEPDVCFTQLSSVGAIHGERSSGGQRERRRSHRVILVSFNFSPAQGPAA